MSGEIRSVAPSRVSAEGGQMTASAALKAYSVTDYAAERSEIVFARFNAEARRRGASIIDSEWEYVECRRTPGFDSYAPGPVPKLALLDSGWWMECHGCGQRISDGRVERAGLEEVECNPIERGAAIFCERACMEVHDAVRAATKQMQDAALEYLRTALLLKLPGVTLTGRDHAYVTREAGVGLVAKQAVIWFTFPGCTVGDASYRYEDGNADVWICNGDKDAWESWRSSASQPTAEGRRDTTQSHPQQVSS